LSQLAAELEVVALEGEAARLGLPLGLPLGLKLAMLPLGLELAMLPLLPLMLLLPLLLLLLLLRAARGRIKRRRRSSSLVGRLLNHASAASGSSSGAAGREGCTPWQQGRGQERMLRGRCARRRVGCAVRTARAMLSRK